MINLSQQIFDEKYKELIVDKQKEWNPKQGSIQDMEVINHILRVIIQNHDVDQFMEAFHNLVDIQHEDGGWGNYTSEEKSHIRVTAFSTQMLLRCNHSLKKRNARFDEAIRKGLSFLINHQKADGTWFDEEWGLYDAVSVSTGTMMFARMLPGVSEEIKTLIEKPYTEGMEFVIRTQRTDGGWDYKQMYVTPVCVTAHLLQKTLGYGQRGRESSRKAINFLVNAQTPEGHYDNQNVDHTCDSIRALMLASEVMEDFTWHGTIEKGMKWLLDNRNEDNGWGDYAGDESNLLIICDGLDTLLKYLRYKKLYDKSQRHVTRS